MGGNATLHYGTKRIDRETYEKIVLFFKDFMDETNKKLEKQGKEKELFGIPLSYLDKDSHGDVDFLSTLYIPSLLSKLAKHPEIIIKDEYLENRKNDNGNYSVNLAMTSAPVKIKSEKFNFETDFFQLDLIAVNKENFDITYNYYCFNDLGNLIGRTAYANGLRFGQEGLYYRFPYEHPFDITLGKEAKLVISKDYFEILRTLGFKLPLDNENKIDKDKFYSMFRTKEDVFNFVKNVDNFTPYAFLNTFKNSKAKMRDNKRKVLNDFVSSLINDGYITEYEAYEASEEELPFKRRDGLEFIDYLVKDKGLQPIIPFEDQLNKIKEKYDKKINHAKYNAKFNGEMIIDHISKEHPNVIEDLKTTYGKDFRKYLGKIINEVKQNVYKKFEADGLNKDDIINLKDDTYIPNLIEKEIKQSILKINFELKKIEDKIDGKMDNKLDLNNISNKIK